MYTLYNFDSVEENQQEIIEVLYKFHARFENTFVGLDTSGATGVNDGYMFYNIWSATSPNLVMYNLFKELKTFVRRYLAAEHKLGEDDPLWLQSWVNIQTQDKVLPWHEHEWDYHGYMSIIPKNTTTEFERYSIENKVGQLYMAPCLYDDGEYRSHKVTVNEPFEGDRITIAFDVISNPEKYQDINYYSFIPI